MSEGWLRHLAGNRFESLSAGANPADSVYPLAVQRLSSSAFHRRLGFRGEFWLLGRLEVRCRGSGASTCGPRGRRAGGLSRITRKSNSRRCSFT